MSNFIPREKIFSIPSHGTFIMHPGICPKYRNSHGCFWAIANEDYEDSIENLLNIFKIDKSWENGKAKDQLILLFDTLGNKNELVLKARRKLSSIIFS